MTPEEKAEQERRRREARKNRIQSHAGGRLGFIAEQVKDPTDTPPKKIEDDDDDSLDNNEIPTPSDNNKKNNTPSNNNNNNNNNSNNNNIFERRRHLPQHSRSTIRLFGIVMFSLLFASNTIIMSAKESEIKDRHPIYKYLVQLKSMVDQQGNDSLTALFEYKELLICTLPLMLLWVAWEYVMGYSKSMGRFFPVLKSDSTIVAFLYTVTIDLTLRFGHQLQIVPPSIESTSLISGLYIPLAVALLSQYVIKSIPDHFPIVNMNDTIRRGYESIANIIVMVATLLVCIDWWACTSSLCQDGLLSLIANRSRGLLFWSYLCNCFISRVIG
ncbi:putative transmembrane protein [Heterostelium album PN500]|uniref:Putative transmembrane protein n=1 Tax=Heterostelium pallidum (strain ATCC 26659 / Pp 5 / PN500) TaxID=670386 RepID=D3BC15_HETP5|nr:putative transmembrane protein [Heterostelium album PN500]EFA81198.1 putative transmembrane protein [Heterostelium album PN500]|eukprot:XP_020433316.1 putative transmembrane protein [Heterostelium album PN500]